MSYDNLAKRAMDSQQYICYMCEIDTYSLIYLNETAKLAFGYTDENEYVGKKCYEALQGKAEPCDFCNNDKLKFNERINWVYYNQVLGKHFALTDTLLDIDGVPVRMEIASDISGHHMQVNDLELRLSREKVLVDCVRMLSRSEELHEAAENLLAIIGEHYDSETAAIFDFSGRESGANSVYFWSAEFQEKYVSRLESVKHDLFLIWEEHEKSLLSGAIDDECMFKSINDYLYKIGMMSVILTPLKKDGKMVGIIGVENPTRNTEDYELLDALSIFVMDSISKNAQRKHLERLGYTDTLTGAFNRHKYVETVGKLEKKAPESVGVVYVDINGLKNINDLFGHDFGDEVVRKAAEALRTIVSENVYRVGGDEFVVICEEIDENDFNERVFKLREHAANSEESSMSIGSIWKKGQIDIAREVSQSDELMYADKQSYYKAAIAGAATYKSLAAKELLEDLESGCFDVYLQGKVDLSTGKISGAEALVRKYDEDGNVISPIKFIPGYEYDRIIRHVDFFVLETVCKTIRSWIDKGRALKVAVNFSRVTLIENDVVSKMIAMCERYAVPTSYIDIEITESIGKMDHDILARKIEELETGGFSTSLDDFGAEYSNLYMLSEMNFSEVKLDKSMVDGICTNVRSRILVEFSIKMIKELGGMHSLAEGIETEEQCNILKECGCEYGQGYYFYRPMSIEDFERAIEADFAMQ